MYTSSDTRAFWARMLPRYREQLAQATTERDQENWRKRIEEAEAKVNPQPPNQPTV